MKHSQGYRFVYWYYRWPNTPMIKVAFPTSKQTLGVALQFGDLFKGWWKRDPKPKGWNRDLQGSRDKVKFESPGAPCSWDACRFICFFVAAVALFLFSMAVFLTLAKFWHWFFSAGLVHTSQSTCRWGMGVPCWLGKVEVDIAASHWNISTFFLIGNTFANRCTYTW